MVIRGQAAMTVMGDWARVSFNAHGLKPGSTTARSPPGDRGHVRLHLEAFSLPTDAKNKAGRGAC
jgi:hypothetical protein